MKARLAFFILLACTATLALGADPGPVKPSQKDKCPVCGMFVYKYPDWTASIVFRDGSYAVFDGPKDLFTCYLNLQKYVPAQRQADIASLFVTDYYDVQPINARTASYVIGSDVYGPMGKELIPFKTSPAAAEFLKDHQGARILRFQDITQETVAGLN
jgi:copper chaperone NosL